MPCCPVRKFFLKNHDYQALSMRERIDDYIFCSGSGLSAFESCRCPLGKQRAAIKEIVKAEQGYPSSKIDNFNNFFHIFSLVFTARAIK